MAGGIDFGQYLLANQKWLGGLGEAKTDNELDQYEISNFFSGSHLEINSSEKGDSFISEKEFDTWYDKNQDAINKFFDAYDYNFDSDEEAREAMLNAMEDFASSCDVLARTHDVKVKEIGWFNQKYPNYIENEEARDLYDEVNSGNFTKDTLDRIYKSENVPDNVKLQLFNSAIEKNSALVNEFNSNSAINTTYYNYLKYLADNPNNSSIDDIISAKKIMDNMTNNYNLRSDRYELCINDTVMKFYEQKGNSIKDLKALNEAFNILDVGKFIQDNSAINNETRLLTNLCNSIDQNITNVTEKNIDSLNEIINNYSAHSLSQVLEKLNDPSLSNSERLYVLKSIYGGTDQVVKAFRNGLSSKDQETYLPMLLSAFAGFDVSNTNQ